MATGQCMNLSYVAMDSSMTGFQERGVDVQDLEIGVFDPQRASTPQRRTTAVPRIPLTSNVSEMLHNANSGDNLDDVYDLLYDDGGTVDNFEKAAIYEFIESKQKTKYLFDGVNLIKIKPRKNAAIKAIMGKAYYLRKRFSEKLQEKAMQWKTTSKTPALSGGPVVNNEQMGLLSDYVPETGPKIPLLIRECVKEIDARSRVSCEEGIYRVSGSELEIRKLKGLFLANKSVNLHDLDIHTLTGCIKAFLRGLEEPLIPTSMWHDFVEVGNIQCQNARVELVKSLVMNLPSASRDTLAFFVPHLQRISACPGAKMPLASMAKVFSPTIVGYSSRELGVEMRETGSIIGAMSGIINVPQQFWDALLAECGP